MDAIANMLGIAKNGYMAKKPKVTIPFSKFKWEIIKVLENEKFVGKVEKEDSKISAALLYEGNQPKIHEIKIISKQGLRVFSKSKHVKTVKGGRGTYILSTSKGVMSAKEAKNKNLGGEVICRIW